MEKWINMFEFWNLIFSVIFFPFFHGSLPTAAKMHEAQHNCCTQEQNAQPNEHNGQKLGKWEINEIN
jgi:hypothetical protein